MQLESINNNLTCIKTRITFFDYAYNTLKQGVYFKKKQMWGAGL